MNRPDAHPMTENMHLLGRRARVAGRGAAIALLIGFAQISCGCLARSSSQPSRATYLDVTDGIDGQLRRTGGLVLGPGADRSGSPSEVAFGRADQALGYPPESGLDVVRFIDRSSWSHLGTTRTQVLDHSRTRIRERTIGTYRVRSGG